MIFKILPVTRNERKDAKGDVPIYIYIYTEGRLIKKVPLGYKIKPDYWNNETRRMIPKTTNATFINSLIGKMVSDLEQKIMSEQLAGMDVDLNFILNKTTIRDADFFDFCETQIREKNYSEETRRMYRIYIEKIKGFRSRLKLSEVNFKFLQSYQSYLRNDLKNENNTIWANEKFINTMINDAIKAGHIAKADDPFKTFKRLSYKQTKRTFLTAPERAKIEGYISACEDDDIKTVGMYFLFMCYTGLRYSDAVRFNSSLHVVNGERIEMITKKTGKETNLFINDKIKPLAEFVNANRLKISQVDFNRKLKVIAAGAGVNKKVSSHVARHSFGSSLVDLGVDMKLAQKLLSHGSLNSTKIYYHVKDENLDEAMKKFNNQKNNKTP